MSFARKRTTVAALSLVNFLSSSSSFRILGPSASSRIARSLASSATATTKRLFPEELNIIYDSQCGVCKLEIDFLRRRDLRINNGQPRLKFTDLEAQEYDDSLPQNGGINYATGMASIHAVTKDAQIIQGVPVFRRAYEQVGLGWLFVLTEVPGFKQLANLGYKIFARYRTNVTRGESIDTLVEIYHQKKALDEKKAEVNCDDKCKV